MKNFFITGGNNFIGKSLCGKQKKVDRLIRTLRINNSYAREVLNWSPHASVPEGIR